jgi:hypothetical protein
MALAAGDKLGPYEIIALWFANIRFSGNGLTFIAM